MRYGLSEKQLKEIIQIFSSYKEIDEAILFGSRAKGTHKESSDVDIVIKGKNITYSFAAKLKSHFEEDTYLPYFFDIIAYKTITSEELKEHICLYGKTIMNGSKSIPEGWVETTLGEVVTFQRGFDLPAKDRKLGEYPVMVSNGQDGMHNEFKVEAPGVVTGRSGSLGFVFYVQENFWPLNTTLWVKDFHGNNRKFIYYFLKRLPLERYNSGSGVPTLNRNHIHLLSIVIPPLSEQKAIAEVLSSFDDKIENLQAQNKTLEDIAQTIFKEWFGKYRVGDELPDGWRVGKLSEIADFLNGLALQKYLPILGEETLPVIKIRELKQGITENTDKANIHLDEKYIVNNGDVLFSWSGSLEVVIWKFGKGALNQHLFKVTSSNYPKWFYYFWTLHHLKEFKNVAASKATTMGHINRRHLDDAIVFIPNSKTMELVGNNLSSILDKLENNNYQIQTLKKTRDTLLPKLMSGEIQVNDFKGNNV